MWTCPADRVGRTEMKQGLALLVAIMVVPAMPSSIREQHDAGVAAHLERSLSTASAAYDDVLRLDPPREPSADEWIRSAKC